MISTIYMSEEFDLELKHTNTDTISIKETFEPIIDYSVLPSCLVQTMCPQIVAYGGSDGQEKVHNRNSNERAKHSIHGVCEFDTDLYSGAAELAVFDPLKKEEVDLDNVTIATGSNLEICNLSQIHPRGEIKLSTNINVKPTCPSQLEICPTSIIKENAKPNGKISSFNSSDETKYSIEEMCAGSSNLLEAEVINAVDPLNLIKNEKNFTSKNIDLTISSVNNTETTCIDDQQSLQCMICKLNFSSRHLLYIHGLMHNIDGNCDENNMFGSNLGERLNDNNEFFHQNCTISGTQYCIEEMCTGSTNLFEAEVINAVDPLNLIKNEPGFTSQNGNDLVIPLANKVETHIADQQIYQCLICDKHFSSGHELSLHRSKMHKIKTFCEENHASSNVGNSLKINQNCAIETVSDRNLSSHTGTSRISPLENNKIIDVGFTTNLIPPGCPSYKDTHIKSTSNLSEMPVSTSSKELHCDKTELSNQQQVARSLDIEPLSSKNPQNNLQCDLCGAKVASTHSCMIQIDVCQPCLSKSRTTVIRKSIVILDTGNNKAGSQKKTTKDNNTGSSILRPSRAHHALICHQSGKYDVTGNPVSIYISVLVCPYCRTTAAPALSELADHMTVCVAIRTCNICGLKQGATTSCAMEVENCVSCFDSFPCTENNFPNNETTVEGMNSVTASNCKKKVVEAAVESTEKSDSGGERSLVEDENNHKGKQNIGTGNNTQIQKNKTVTNTMADARKTTHMEAQLKKKTLKNVLSANISINALTSQKVVTLPESASNVEVVTLVECSSGNKSAPVEIQLTDQTGLTSPPTVQVKTNNNKTMVTSKENTHFKGQGKSLLCDISTDNSQSPSMEVTPLPERQCASQLHSVTDGVPSTVQQSSNGPTPVFGPFTYKKPPTITKECSVCHVVFTKSRLYRHEKLTLHNRVSCHICDNKVNFKNDDQLKIHLKSKHTLINCRLCLESCKGLIELRLHMKSSHVKTKNSFKECPKVPKKVPFSCNKCTQSFEYKEVLSKHLYYHRFMDFKGASMLCNICEFPSTSTRAMCRHMLLSHSVRINVKESVCKTCGIKFWTKDALQSHIEAAHRITEPLICDICSQSFKARNTIARHLFHHEYIDFRGTLVFCKFCEFSSSFIRCITRHALSSHNDKSVPSAVGKIMDELRSRQQKTLQKTEQLLCNLCAQSFTDKRKLEKHLRYHEFMDFRGMSLFCNRCDFSSTLIMSMNAHMLVFHNIRINAKEHKCKTCGEKFGNNYSLLNHVDRVHHKKEFKCKLCNSELCTYQSLREHERRFHSTTREKSKTFKCLVCSKMFFKKFYLTNHMRTHTGETPYKCSFCDRAFTLTSNLHAHLRLHTGDKPYKCEVCGLAFRHNVSKKNHMKYHKDVPGVVYTPPVNNRKYVTKKKKNAEDSDDDVPLSNFVNKL